MSYPSEFQGPRWAQGITRGYPEMIDGKPNQQPPAYLALRIVALLLQVIGGVIIGIPIVACGLLAAGPLDPSRLEVMIGCSIIFGGLAVGILFIALGELIVAFRDLVQNSWG